VQNVVVKQMTSLP